MTCSVARHHPGAARLRGWAAIERARRVLPSQASTCLPGDDDKWNGPLTVKTHVNRAMMKLGARDRAQLVLAYEGGLVHVGRQT